MSEPNLGMKLRLANLEGALRLVDSIKTNEHGVPRYSRNKELAKWQATAWILAQSLRSKAL
jgi:hypothetical protein